MIDEISPLDALPTVAPEPTAKPDARRRVRRREDRMAQAEAIVEPGPRRRRRKSDRQPSATSQVLADDTLAALLAAQEMQDK